MNDFSVDDISNDKPIINSNDLSEEHNKLIEEKAQTKKDKNNQKNEKKVIINIRIIKTIKTRSNIPLIKEDGKGVNLNKNLKNDFNQLSNEKIKSEIIIKLRLRRCFYNWKLSSRSSQINNIDTTKKNKDKRKDNQKEIIREECIKKEKKFKLV